MQLILNKPEEGIILMNNLKSGANVIKLNSLLLMRRENILDCSSLNRLFNLIQCLRELSYNYFD
jgi:hypothetical protein